MYFRKIPRFIQQLFKKYLWHGDRSKKKLFLTFDDGPNPESTPIILDILKKYGVPATFFCLGENVEKYPELFQRIKDEGHQVGNHSYSHLSGWTTSTISYIEDVQKGNQLIQSNLFRPPYGRIRPAQANILSRHFRIVMWDVMPGDFDKRLASAQIISNVTGNVENGSIIVLHDYLYKNYKIEEYLPQIIEIIQDANITFEIIEP